MSHASRGLTLALLLLVAATAHAQSQGRDWPREERERHRVPTHADSTRTLLGRWQVWTHAGVDWLASPASVRSRYSIGLTAGATGERRFADRSAVRARLEYEDLPSSRPNIIVLNGSQFASPNTYGHGWFTAALGGFALRPWRHAWIEGTAGGDYFRSGFPSGQVYADPVTGRLLPLNANSGWGSIWAVAVRYEFQPSLRDRMMLETQMMSFDRGGTPLTCWSIRVGYRAL